MNITFCIGGAIGAALMPSWVLNIRRGLCKTPDLNLR